MGGVFEGKNNILNCAAWREIYKTLSAEQIENAKSRLNKKFLRLAPITGAQENIGWHDEKSFYAPFIKACFEAGINLAIGDGCPDEKLIFGIDAIRALQTKTDSKNPADFNNRETLSADTAQSVERSQNNFDFKNRNGLTQPPLSGALCESHAPRAAVFLKPYPQEKLFERIEWSAGVAEFLGVDIDAYNIATMRNKVNLEKKSAAQLNELRRIAKKPFIIKGVFTKDDLRLVEEFKPDVALVSNHGGRVETDIGSTAEFLQENFAFLKKHCGAVWVDGGIRTAQDALTAAALGAEQILLGRPLVTAFCKDEATGIKKTVENFLIEN